MSKAKKRYWVPGVICVSSTTERGAVLLAKRFARGASAHAEHSPGEVTVRVTKSGRAFEQGK